MANFADPTMRWQNNIDESFNGRFNAAFDRTNTSSNQSFWNSQALPNMSELDYGYLNSAPATSTTANALNTPQDQWPSDPGNEVAANKQNKFNNFGNTVGNAVDTVTGKPLGTSSGPDWNQYFVRATVIVLGFIFVAAGLYMFGGPKVLERIKPT